MNHERPHVEYEQPQYERPRVVYEQPQYQRPRVVYKQPQYERPRVVYKQPQYKRRCVVSFSNTLPFTRQNVPTIIQDLFDTWNSGAGNSLSAAVYKIKTFPRDVLRHSDELSEVAKHGRAFEMNSNKPTPVQVKTTESIQQLSRQSTITIVFFFSTIFALFSTPP